MIPLQYNCLSPMLASSLLLSSSETLGLCVVLCFNFFHKNLDYYDILRLLLQKYNPGSLSSIIGKGDIVLFSAVRSDKKWTTEISMNNLERAFGTRGRGKGYGVLNLGRD